MKSFRALDWLIMICVAIPWSVARAGDDSRPAWRLRPSAAVDATGLRLEAIVESIDQVPNILLAAAPPIGRTNSYSRSTIQDWVREKFPAAGHILWSGATQVTVVRQARTMQESELIELLAATLQSEFVRDRGELELRLSRPWPPAQVPDEPISVKILELPAAGVTPNFIMRFELVSGKETVGRFQLPLQARVLRETLIAGTKLERGQSFRRSDITRERRDVLALRGALASFPEDWVDVEVAENIPAGAAITARSVRRRPIIHRGKVVEAMLTNGALQISVKVEALEDGLPGQTVRVRNLKSKREFRGKVHDEETILVTL